MKAKRRYVKRKYHHVFGYYIGAEIVRTQKTHTHSNNTPGMYGRPDLCGKFRETDLPLAFNESEAREFYARQEPFAFVTLDNRAGFVEEKDYEERKERKDDDEPQFSKVKDCYQDIVNGGLRYL